MEQITSVNDYITSKPNWEEEILLLREIILGTPLVECMKWSAPAYTYNKENILGLLAFKDYVGLWFHQGAFLKDEAKLLLNANESKTRGLRQWRFTKIDQIEMYADLIDSYILEAIENQKAGLKIKIERGKVVAVPKELTQYLANNHSLEVLFKKLSRTKQNEFSNYIASAKRPATKDTRLLKIGDLIANGKGLNDKYKP